MNIIHSIVYLHFLCGFPGEARR